MYFKVFSGGLPDEIVTDFEQNNLPSLEGLVKAVSSDATCCKVLAVTSCLSKVGLTGFEAIAVKFSASLL